MGSSKHAFEGIPKPYTDYSRIQIAEIDSDEWREQTIIGQFASNASSLEGVSGRKPIDTLYENTDEDIFEMVKSGNSDTPAPIDVKSGRYPHRHI